MNFSKTVLFSMFVIFISCGSYKQSKKKTFTYDVTYQYWVSEDKEHKGFDLLIPIKHNPEGIELDSVYFKNKSTKLTTWYPKKSKIKHYVGRFYITTNQNIDTTQKAINFYKELDEDQCIVTYKKDGAHFHKKLKGINDISHHPFYLTRE